VSDVGQGPAEESPASFLELLDEHTRLFDLFLEHQEALVSRDFPRALERLKAARAGFEEHIRGEEELFRELFAHTDEVRGTPLDLFTGEHKHLREMLAGFEAATGALDPAAKRVARDVIELLDEEALFKTFFRHHDERERNLLYPAFDRGTAGAGRRERLRRFHAPPPA
jgi:hemerythrin-like domain-containing protein